MNVPQCEKENQTFFIYFFLIIHPQLSGSICGSVFWVVPIIQQQILLTDTEMHLERQR